MIWSLYFPSNCFVRFASTTQAMHLNIQLLSNLQLLFSSDLGKCVNACVTMQSQVPLPLIFLSYWTFTVLPALSGRSSSDTRMLKLQRFNRKTHGFRTFSHFVPHIRNNLPQDRHSATLSSFKSKLKTFLFSEYFS